MEIKRWNYKKPAFWVVIVAVVTCLAVAVCCLTDPREQADLDFLNYERLSELAAQSDTLSVEAFDGSEVTDYTVDGHELAVWLDNASWTPQRGLLRVIARRDADENSTASVQIQLGSVFLRIFDTDMAYIYAGMDGKNRFYRMQAGDYQAILTLASSPTVTAEAAVSTGLSDFER